MKKKKREKERKRKKHAPKKCNVQINFFYLYQAKVWIDVGEGELYFKTLIISRETNFHLYLEQNNF